MAIKYEILRFPVVGGLDTKSAAAATPFDKLQVLQNGEFTKRGSVRTRRGYEELPGYVGSAEVLGTTKAVAAKQDDVMLVTDRRVYSRDPLRDEWVDRGVYNSTVRTAADVAVSAGDQASGGSATVAGVTGYVWKSAANTLKFTIVNAETRAVYVHEAALASATCDRPAVAAAGSNLLFFYHDTATNDLMCKVVSALDPVGTYATAAVTVIGDLTAAGIYAVSSIPSYGQVYLTWLSDGTGAVGAGGIGLASVSSAGVASRHTEVETSATVDAVAVNFNPHTAMVCVAWVDNPARMYRIYTADCIALKNAQSMGNQAAAARVAVAPIIDEDSVNPDDFAVAYESTAAAVSNHFVAVFDRNSSTSHVVQHAHLASAGFAQGGLGCFVFGHQSVTGLQNGYYLYDNKGNMLGSLANGVASTRPTNMQYPEYTADRMVLNIRRKLDVDLYEAQFAANALREYRFDQDAEVSTATAGEAQYLSGSQLWMYDGVSATEAGFHMFPDVQVGSTVLSTGVRDFAVSNAGGGVLVDNVQYNYRFYYEWYNAAGERVRSAFVQRSFRPDFSGATGRIVITIPTLAHTSRASDQPLARTDVSIVVYRSEGDKSQLFYRVSSANPADVDNTGATDNAYLRNDATTTTVTFSDNLPDTSATPGAALTSRELDMESIGELKHVSPPAPAIVCYAGTRLWLAGGEVPLGKVLGSKETGALDTAQFSGELLVPVAGEAITALGTVDETLIAFSHQRTHGVAGYINNLGQGDGFIASQVTSDVGCTEPGSVVTLPQGLMFKSAKGIYALDRAGEASYIGAEVEAFNSEVVRAAHVVPDTNQVLFLTEGSLALMYDYLYGQWGTHTNHGGTSAASTDSGDFYYLRNDGSVFRRTEAYTDAGSPIALKLRTAPFWLEGFQGFWRLRRVGVVGEYKSPHDLRCGIYHGRDEVATEVFTWHPNDVLDLATWGDEALWGDWLVWGGDLGSTDYQFLHRTRRQKSQQIRLEFEAILTSQPGAAFELTEIMLEVGQLPGIARLSTARKV